NLFIRAPDSVAGLTRRRLEEVEWLLRLQQGNGKQPWQK
ncbi:hypothetical protein ACSLNU_16730, partial [Klebsiella variicola]